MLSYSPVDFYQGEDAFRSSFFTDILRAANIDGTRVVAKPFAVNYATKFAALVAGQYWFDISTFGYGLDVAPDKNKSLFIGNLSLSTYCPSVGTFSLRTYNAQAQGVQPVEMNLLYRVVAAPDLNPLWLHFGGISFNYLTVDYDGTPDGQYYQIVFSGLRLAF